MRISSMLTNLSFVISNELTVVSEPAFSQETLGRENVRYRHKVIKGTLNNDPGKSWIRKEAHNPGEAKIEVLAQEFLRLIIPYQPETLVEQDASTGVCYIFSEEVLGYRPLPPDQAINFSNGHYTGLGRAMLCALFLSEIDLKNGNIGLNDRGQVIKIDGDQCFGGRYYREKSLLDDISVQALAALPYPVNTIYNNWLDIIYLNQTFPESYILSPVLSNDLQFRKEVNQALLMICVLPDELIERFVDAYTPAAGNYFLNLIQDRRDALRHVALQNESFRFYVITADANDALRSIKAQALSFKKYGLGLIIPEDRNVQLAAQMDIFFEQYRREIAPLIAHKEGSLAYDVLDNMGQNQDNVSRVLYALKGSDILAESTIDTVQSWIENHPNLSLLADACIAFNNAGLLTGLHATTIFQAILSHKKLCDLADAINAANKAGLLTGDNKWSNCQLILKCPSPAAKAYGVRLLNKEGLFLGEQGQANFISILENSKPRITASWISILSKENLLTGEQAQINRMTVQKHPYPEDAARALRDLNKIGLLTQVTREIISAAEEPEDAVIEIINKHEMLLQQQRIKNQITEQRAGSSVANDSKSIKP